jgi:hypothetical protein
VSLLLISIDFHTRWCSLATLAELLMYYNIILLATFNFGEPITTIFGNNHYPTTRTFLRRIISIIMRPCFSWNVLTRMGQIFCSLVQDMRYLITRYCKMVIWISTKKTHDRRFSHWFLIFFVHRSRSFCVHVPCSLPHFHTICIERSMLPFCFCHPCLCAAHRAYNIVVIEA